MDKTDKYAKPEYERRFLLPSVPADSHTPVRITDRYLDGTNLRLRRVERLNGEILELKLGQKVRPNPADPSLVFHTSMYLTTEDYERVAVLDSHTLTKIRHQVDQGAVDVHASGVVILEADFSTKEAAETFTAPSDVIREVTLDEEFTGAGLAGL